MRLAVRRWEDGTPGSPTAILLHGITASSRTWWRVGPALQNAGYRVLALDLRGHGDSPSSGGAVTREELAEDVRETLAEVIGQDASPDIIWGHSRGAIVTLTLLASDPQFARAAIIEDPPLRPRPDVDDAIATWRDEARLAREEPERFVHQLLEQNPLWHERDARENVVSVASCDIESVIATVRQPQELDTAALFRALRVPALLILGSELRGSVAHGSDRATLLSRLPAHVEVAELDAGHTVHRDRFAECLGAVLDWCRRAERLTAVRP